VKEAFIREFLALDGLPSHDAFSRVFRVLDPEQFRACFQTFMTQSADACQGVIAIDGKVLRRSFDTASAKSAPHMVSAWGREQRLAPGQIATDAKSSVAASTPDGVNIDPLRQISQRIFALQGGQGHIRLENQRAVPACSLGHDLSRCTAILAAVRRKSRLSFCPESPIRLSV
jgi:hypothetical protein